MTSKALNRRANTSDKYAGKTSHERAAEAEQMLADHVKGMRVTQLAEKYGVGHATVSRRLAAAIASRTAVTVDAYRERQNALLDELMRDHETNLAAGTLLVQQGSTPDDEGRVNVDLVDRGLERRARALEGMLRVADRRARLNGLDAPIKAEVEVTEVTAQERELRDLLEQAAREQAAREAALSSDEVPA